MIGILRRNIELMLADAARQINLPMVLSSASSERLETVVARAPDHVWAQLYASEDARITGSMVRHAQDAGAAALVWTVDIPVASQYVRLVRAGFAVPHSLGFADKLEALTHVGWMSEYLRGGMDRMRQWEAYLPEGAPVREAHRLFAAQRNASQTWKELEVLRRMWAGPLIVKGILHPGDAIRAAEMGVDGVIVSNHGGNTLDRAPASIDMLPGVVAAVGDKLTVMFDGGVRRGSDIVLARCLGAKFVFTGRATLYGAAAGGSAGALRAMAILKDGVDRTLGQLGCNSLEDLSLDFVQQ
jgi:L-lactate dehydrogenase (cytochrome)/(S)-mandelate dehydrogenase